QVGATLPPDSLSEPPKGGGETALQITNSMKAAVDQLTKVVQKAESEITERIKKITALVNDNNSYFVAARPALAGAAPGQITGSSGLGDAE
ncbi:MAG TPA: hypothetical protein VG674_18715, partial [Amycolatopsis sp.]|nr:hypothetical protein [Amycolatopsis sp.]